MFQASCLVQLWLNLTKLCLLAVAILSAKAHNNVSVGVKHLAKCRECFSLQGERHLPHDEAFYFHMTWHASFSMCCGLWGGLQIQRAWTADIRDIIGLYSFFDPDLAGARRPSLLSLLAFTCHTVVIARRRLCLHDREGKEHGVCKWTNVTKRWFKIYGDEDLSFCKSWVSVVSIALDWQHESRRNLADMKLWVFQLLCLCSYLQKTT